MNLRGPLYELECQDCNSSTSQPIDESMADWLEEEHAEAYPDHVVERTKVETADGEEMATPA